MVPSPSLLRCDCGHRCLCSRESSRIQNSSALRQLLRGKTNTKLLNGPWMTEQQKNLPSSCQVCSLRTRRRICSGDRLRGRPTRRYALAIGRITGSWAFSNSRALSGDWIVAEPLLGCSLFSFLLPLNTTFYRHSSHQEFRPRGGNS